MKYRLLILLCLFQAARAQRLPQILDMVHHTPGEAPARSAFTNPAYLARLGYDGQVVNDFAFAHAAITFDRLNPDIFPAHSPGRAWVMAAAEKVRVNIRRAHAAGIRAYYFTDLIVLPKRLVELYRADICDSTGKISLERPKTIEVHRLLLRELFDTFPDLDGLVIRTGETYLNNVPYHTGNNPITNGVASHLKLLELLRDEVCVKRNKKVFYRTWSFGGMHDDPVYYLAVTNQIAPHPNLFFSVKHTLGDYQRTAPFNPTLGIGKHQQIVEAQCQREYEGKGAYPNYIAAGVISGFEENKSGRPGCLQDLRGNPVFSGLWTWSRGGGWAGPYIRNEFWCRLNAWVLSHWAMDTSRSEVWVFGRFMTVNGITGKSRGVFRRLCLLSAKAVLKGHASARPDFRTSWAWWMRDEFLGGIDPNIGGAKFDSEGLLYQAFANLDQSGQLDGAIAEKQEAVRLWEEIDRLARSVQMKSASDAAYIRISCRYGLLLHRIIAEGWNIMGMGYQGDRNGHYPYAALRTAISRYDRFWLAYRQLARQSPSCATLYQPYAFRYRPPDYHGAAGMAASVDHYRKLLINQR